MPVIEAISAKTQGLKVAGSWISCKRVWKFCEKLKVGDDVEVKNNPEGEVVYVGKTKDVGSATYINKEKAVVSNDDDRINSILIAYSKDCYVAELKALVPHCKSLEEAKSVMTERAELICERAQGFKALIGVLNQKA